MESKSYKSETIIFQCLEEMINACEMILIWNLSISDADNYLTSPEGMKTLAATSMMIEAIGENVKKIDKLDKDFLMKFFPDISWKNIIGMRDHIAHGYFYIDANIVFDVVTNEIDKLKEIFKKAQTYL